MENKITLTGISFEYNTTVFYEYNDLNMVEFFKCLIGSNVLKHLGKIHLRYQFGKDQIFDLNVIPESEDRWIVNNNIASSFSFRHHRNRNLMDEIEELLPRRFSNTGDRLIAHTVNS